jgi:hypothetical protein
VNFRTSVVHADGDGGIIIETQQDVTEILQAVNEIRDADKARTGHLNDFHHVGKIPFTVIDEMNKKGIMRGFHIVDDAEFAKWMNGAEGQVWKTYRGTL